MDESGGSSKPVGEGGINRRNLLKGAAAAGVGAAVWTAPHFRTLGTVPAGATHTGTTTVPTDIDDASPLNSQNGSDATFCETEYGDTDSWGNAGDPGYITIKPPAAIKDSCGMGNNERIVVDVRGCVFGPGNTAQVLQFTGTNGNPGNPVTDLHDCGVCCQVAGIFISTSGNSGPFNDANAVGLCDPKTFDAAPASAMGSSGIFITATVICSQLEDGDCCSP